MNPKTLPIFQRSSFLTLLAALFCGASMAAENPDDAYLEAYLTFEKAAQLEQQGDFHGAVRRLSDAQQQFVQVQAKWPDYQPDVVNHRLKKLQESITALNAQLGLETVDLPALPPLPPEAVTSPLPTVPPTGTQSNATGGGDAFDSLRQRMQMLEAENQRFQEEIARLKAETERKEAAYQENLNQLTVGRQRQIDLERQVSALEERLAVAADGDAEELLEIRQQLVNFRKQYSKAQQEAEEAETRAIELAGELDEARSSLDIVREQVKKMEAEELPERIAALTEENELLRNDLDTARERIGMLEVEAVEKDRQIAGLQQNIEDIRQQMVLLKQENVQYQSQVAELTTELRSAHDRIAALPTDNGSDPVLAEENQLLRTIIMRQLRAQVRQQQAKALIVEELEKMDQVSSNLLTYVNDLTSVRVVLSDEEKALFQEPQLQELFGDDTDATVMAPVHETQNGNGTDEPKETELDEAQVSSEVPAENRAALADLLRKAKDEAAQRNFAAAESAYEDFLRADPRNVEVLCNLGVVKINLSKLDDAETALRRALEFSDQKHPAAHFYLGVSQFRRNRLNEAFSSIEESLRQDANNAQARHFLGVISSRLGLRDRAQAEFKSAIALDPDYAAAHFNLAVLYATFDPPDYEAAHKHYIEAVSKGASRDEKMERMLAEHVSMDTVAN